MHSVAHGKKKAEVFGNETVEVILARRIFPSAIATMGLGSMLYTQMPLFVSRFSGKDMGKAERGVLMRVFFLMEGMAGAGACAVFLERVGR